MPEDKQVVDDNALLEMGEDAASLEYDEATDTIKGAPGKPDVKPDPEPEVDKPEGTAEPEKDEKPEAKPEEEEPEKPESTTDDPEPKEVDYKKRWSDTNQALRAERSKAREAERKLLAKDQELKLQKLKFEELSQAEQDELLEDDPARWKEYQKQVSDFNSQKQQIQGDIQQRLADIQIEEVKEFAREFYPDTEVSDRNKILSFIQSEEFKAVDDFLERKVKPDDAGIWSVEDMAYAYRNLNFDKIVESRAKSAREQVVDKMDKIRENKAPLDTADTEKDEKSKVVDFDKLSQDEIEAMDESQVRDALKKYENSGV